MTILDREQQLQVNAIARSYQERYDQAFEPWGARARSPVMGEDIRDFRRDLAVQAKKLLPEGHQYRKNQYRKLDDSVMDVLEPQLLQVVVKEAHNPLNVPLGELRKIERHDQTGRVSEIHWIGQESFVKLMPNYRPGRKVVRLTQPSDNRGRALNEFGHATPSGRLVIHQGQVWGTTGERAF
jgi:hypothetical protein